MLGCDSGDPSGTDAGVDEHAPKILEFTTNVPSIDNYRETDPAVRFSLIATDPDGIDDIIGVSLKSSDRTKTYATLATTGQEGAYSVELRWSDINMTTPISSPANLDVQFVALVYDTAGHEASATVALDFTCREDGVCTGDCIYLRDNAQNCGACGHQCGRYESCDESACAVQVNCDPADFFPTIDGCGNTACSPIPGGFECVAAGAAATGAVGMPCTKYSCAQGGICGSNLAAPHTTSVCQKYCKANTDCPGTQTCLNLFTALGEQTIPHGGEQIGVCVP